MNISPLRNMDVFHGSLNKQSMQSIYNSKPAHEKAMEGIHNLSLLQNISDTSSIPFPLSKSSIIVQERVVDSFQLIHADCNKIYDIPNEKMQAVAQESELGVSEKEVTFEINNENEIRNIIPIEINEGIVAASKKPIPATDSIDTVLNSQNSNCIKESSLSLQSIHQMNIENDILSKEIIKSNTKNVNNSSNIMKEANYFEASENNMNKSIKDKNFEKQCQKETNSCAYIKNIDSISLHEDSSNTLSLVKEYRPLSLEKNNFVDFQGDYKPFDNQSRNLLRPSSAIVISRIHNTTNTKKRRNSCTNTSNLPIPTSYQNRNHTKVLDPSLLARKKSVELNSQDFPPTLRSKINVNKSTFRKNIQAERSHDFDSNGSFYARNLHSHHNLLNISLHTEDIGMNNNPNKRYCKHCHTALEGCSDVFVPVIVPVFYIQLLSQYYWIKDEFFEEFINSRFRSTKLVHNFLSTTKCRSSKSLDKLSSCDSRTKHVKVCKTLTELEFLKPTQTRPHSTMRSRTVSKNHSMIQTSDRLRTSITQLRKNSQSHKSSFPFHELPVRKIFDFPDIPLSISFFAPPYIPQTSEFCIYCFEKLQDENSEQIVLKYVPLTQPFALKYKWNLGDTKYKVIESIFKEANFTCSCFDDNSCNVLWGLHLNPSEYYRLNQYQRVNHWIGSTNLGRKDLLYINLDRMRRQFGRKDWGFFPKTYFFPNCRSKLIAKTKHLNRLWIVKPKAEACGRNISIVQDLNDIDRRRECLVQEYIDNPLLINDKKFDLRLYVLVTDFDPLKIYVYSDGLVRFASEVYSNTTTDRFAALTNYSLNKRSKKYISNNDPTKNDVGNKWTCKGLRKWFRRNNIDDTPIWQEIYDIMIKTIISVESKINAHTHQYISEENRGCCFEIYGFDILLDQELKSHLMEVNIGPSLHTSSTIDKVIKSNLIRNVLQISGITPYDRGKVSNEHELLTILSKHISSLNPSECTYSFRNHNGMNWIIEKRPIRRTLKELEKLKHLDKLTFHDKKIITTLQAEYVRRKDFIRLFPNTSSETRYRKYFQSNLYNNLLIFLWMKETPERQMELLKLPCQYTIRKIKLKESIPMPVMRSKTPNFRMLKSVSEKAQETIKIVRSKKEFGRSWK